MELFVETEEVGLLRSKFVGLMSILPFCKYAFAFVDFVKRNSRRICAGIVILPLEVNVVKKFFIE